jgi:iron complex transport system ATP-binding protein
MWIVETGSWLSYARVMCNTDLPLLESKKLRVSVPGRLLVDELDLSLQRGELVAVLGQNGAGKSLTLHTLAGLRAADSGQVLLVGEDILASRRQQTARRLALLPQVIDDIFPATVLDTALIGRHPHIGHLRWESDRDYEIANDALRTMGLEGLSTRDILTLSGGERRRLAIAQVLTQSPDVYLLDEPTNHLDPQHQLDTLHVFRRAADAGAGVIACLHDVNLAVRFADRCLLLFGDGRWELGESKEVLSESRLSQLFATKMETVNWRSYNLFVASSDHAAL